MHYDFKKNCYWNLYIYKLCLIFAGKMMKALAIIFKAFDSIIGFIMLTIIYIYVYCKWLYMVY